MISVICPILNEIRFLPAWLACVKKFADQLVVVDTGSNDGSVEFLRSQGIEPYFWPDKLDYKTWNTGTEGKVRNFLISKCKGDWIVPLDADELVDHDFISLLKSTDFFPFLIGRFVHNFFWEDFNKLRVRSLKPLLFFQGRWYPLRNWRGNYPGKIPRLFKNIPEIRYSTSNKHCLLQYKNYGWWGYHMPWITKDFELPFYHYHYCFGKEAGNKDWELGQEVKTVPFLGIHPIEAGMLRDDSRLLGPNRRSTGL